MKIFLDTANISHIKKWSESGLIDGITTNPSNLSKENQNPREILKEICSILPDKDISVEITEENPIKVYNQAKEISKIADNITVKIPCYKDYINIINKLVTEGIKLNITLVFSVTQALMMAKLGVKYISPFIGRLDDIGSDGLALISECRNMLDIYNYETQLLAASIRSVKHLQDIILTGADVATLPTEILGKSLEHPLTDIGIKKFSEDWEKLDIKQFP